MSSKPQFSPVCVRCKGALKLDDFAIDTSCQGKHVFFFKCAECGDFSATAMNNVPQNQWPEFIPEDQITEIEAKYEAAKKQDTQPF